ncbi:MAG: hypothetical protein R3A48_01140 [Polyangiales bacterium]
MSDEGERSTRQYEFSAAEHAVVRELAQTLSVTGLVLMALGIVAILYAGVFIAGSRQDLTPLVVAALCAPMVIAGFWLRATAEPLLRLSDAKGEAVKDLMTVLKEFTRIFALQRTGFALALVVAVAGVIVQVTR